MMKNFKTFLIIFLSILILSITPAIAVQTSETNNTSSDVNTAWAEGVEKALAAISNQEYTELTPEQEEYLETHQDGVQARGEAVLNNLQNYVNQVEEELSKYDTSENSPKNTIDDKFADSIEKITNFLKNKDIPVQNATYTYEELSRKVNDKNKTASLDGSKVIVQMKDGISDYVVYAELLNINNETISIKTPKKSNEVWSAKEFKTHHSLDGNLNVIIVPQNTSRSYILDLIFQFQKDDLNTRINWCVAGVGICSAVLGTYGLALISNALLKCSENTIRQTMMNLVIQRFEEQGEATYLDPHGKFRGFVEGAQAQPGLKRYIKPTVIVGLGVVFIITCVPLIVKTYTLKGAYETEKTNLDKWG
jgi:hypothetical protein